MRRETLAQMPQKKGGVYIGRNLLCLYVRYNVSMKASSETF